MKSYFITILVFYSFSIIAQPLPDFENYKVLKCAGEIPGDFKSGIDKWTGRVLIPETEGEEHVAAYKVLAASQIMNRLYSGNILYGDMLTNYVNAVADSALVSNPELRKKLSFYVMKNSDFNAYSTPSGVILISMGLLARIETEAQLAYIICHEAAHFNRNHNFKAYVFRNSQGKGRKAPDQKVLQKRILEYSKNHELEADADGLNYFLASSYAAADVEPMFRIMLYSYLPFAEIPFDTSYFNTGTDYRIPHKYFPEKIAGISAEEDVPDSMRTHPNILKRRSAVKLLIEKNKVKDGLSFLQSKELFELIRKTARLEMAQIYLNEAEYEEAIYAAFLIEKLYGKSIYTSKVIASALYILAKHKNHKTEQDRMPFNRAGSTKKINVDNAYWESIEGESQAVYFFVSLLPPREMNILAARFNFDMYKQFGGEFFLKRCDNLMAELKSKHQMEAIDFYGLDTNALNANSKCRGENLCAVNMNYIKGSAKRIEKNCELHNYSRNSYFLYAFKDHYADSIFVSRYNQVYYFVTYLGFDVEKPEVLTKSESGDTSSRILMIYPDYNAYIRKYASGSFTVYSYRVSNPKLGPVYELNTRRNLTGLFSQYAADNKLNLHISGLGNLDSMTTEEFNKYQTYLNWYYERAQAGENSLYVYNDEVIAEYAMTYSYLVYTYMNNTDKELEFVYVLIDLKSGEMKLIYKDEDENAGPESSKAAAMLRKAIRSTSQKTSSEK